MRLWSLHPKYLDRAWLLACWREWLLAKNVLEGNTKWYKNHPQLNRFKRLDNPIGWINAFLSQILMESKNRWYNFSDSKINKMYREWMIEVTIWQVEFEKKHLLNKLSVRDLKRFKILSESELLEINPIFKIIEWQVESWERI